MKLHSPNVPFIISSVALFARAWIEIFMYCLTIPVDVVALFARAWIEIVYLYKTDIWQMSPSLRGRGLKYMSRRSGSFRYNVALFARAWIEMSGKDLSIIAIGRPLCEGVD